MDGESIRNGLRDVFGSFDEFCQNISNSGPLSTRHGVVTPITPVAPRTNPFPSSRSRTPPISQTARSCIQTMSDLVDDSPLLPPHIASFNRDLYQDPSSSTRSATDETEIGKRRDRRRNRNPDSDSEFERDNRKRNADHNTRPGTSRAIQEDDAMKELFGDDNTKPNGSEKAISPDSGVHSNEGSDETDVQTILSTMCNLLPMLSPIIDSPRDKDLQRKENERKQRKAAEQKRREEEKQEQKQREQEEKERKRRIEKEAAKKAEKERKEAEERERAKKEADRKREEADRKKEDERLRKEIQERQKQKKEEGKRREEERQRNEDKHRLFEERKRLDEKRKEGERQHREEQRKMEERIKAEEQDRLKAERDEKLKQEAYEDEQPVESSNRLKGMLSLRNLSSEKMSQLLDMSKSLKAESKSSRPSSPYIERKERPPKEEKLFAESEIARRNLEIKNVPSPRIGSGNTRREFHCASNECVPQRPTMPVKSKDAEVLLADSYHELARSKKRQADTSEDMLNRIFLYLESMAYFSLAAYQYSLEKADGRHVSIMRDTSRLIEAVTSRFLHNESRSPLEQHFTSRIKVISLRAQSILGYHVFNYKLPNALKMHSLIEKTNRKVVQQNGDVFSSPGESGSSQSNQNINEKQISMPLELFNNYKIQLQQLHGLMFAHKQWSDSTTFISKSPADTLFMNTLESICGTLSITMAIDKMAISVLTGITWLRDEHEIELKRPQPVISQK